MGYGIREEVVESVSLAPSPLPLRWLSGKRWQLAAVDERAVAEMQQRLGLPEVLCRLLVHRGVGWEQAENYLNPTLKNLLPDPFHLLDMDKVVTRLIAAIESGETIGVFGDYDVDGATSSALLLKYFREIGAGAAVHIPDRQKEGYGPNMFGFARLREQGAKLVVTVDTGTLAHAVLAQARAEGYEVIVIDHHLSEAELPEAVAVVNPNRADETSEYGALAAVGVTFLLLVGFNKRLRERGFFHERPEPDLRALLDIVALGTVADVVPLTGLNRAFVAQGLKILAQRGNIGLAALMEVAGLNENPSPYSLGFLLGPRINAGGRVGESDLGVRLLTSEDPLDAVAIAARLDHHNQERKAIEAQVLDQALAMAATQANRPMILVGAEGWHEGVIGIVAGRLKEQFNRPAAVISWNAEGRGKASARSVSGVDLGRAVIAARAAGLLLAGGGHRMAAGFTVAQEHFPALEAFFEEHLSADVSRYLAEHAGEVEGSLPVSALTVELAALLERAGPYGAGNPTPRFLLPRVRLVAAEVLKSKHLRLIAVEAEAVQASPARVKVMGFGMVETPLGQELLNHRGRHFSLIGKIKAETWQGRQSVSFLLEDAALV